MAEKEQSNRLKRSLTEHRYFTCFGINLYDNLVLFQSVVDSIRSPSAFPIEGTDHNIRVVDHVSIAGKKTPSVILFRSNYRLICCGQNIIFALLICFLPWIRLPRKRNDALKGDFFVFLLHLKNLLGNPCIETAGNTRNAMRPPQRNQSCTKNVIIMEKMSIHMYFMERWYFLLQYSRLYDII